MQRSILAAALLLSACATSPASLPEPAPLPALPPVAMHEAAPDVPFMDLEGNRHVLSEFQGKTVMVFFYAHACPISKRTLPKLDEMAAHEAANGVVVLPIERTGAGPDQVRGFIEKSGTKQKLYYDPSLRAANAFQIDKQPWVYVVAPSFKVEADMLGELPLSAYQNVVKRYNVK
jgi:thiol-disulfide isomerase/thioredoxin